MKTLLLSIFLCGFFTNTAFGSVLGDYQSNVNTTGNWTSISSWLYYNGSAWVPATNYPGQIVGTGAVLIQSGDTITMGTADLTTTMSSLTISGTLVLDGGKDGGLFTINTQSIIVTAGLTPYANIDFHNKVTLALPANATIQVGIGGLPTPGSGTCNNNIEISIGGLALAYCTGTGSPPAEYTFSDLINNGGYYVVNASISPTAVCESGSFVITATPLPSSGVTAINWYTVPSGGSSISSSNPYTTSVISTTTTYYVEATYSFGYTTPRKAIVATVNPNLPASVSIAASSSGAICSGTSVTFTATPTNGGATPAYQWKLNGGNVGTNSATYTNSALANGANVTCDMTSNAPCITGNPATSNVVIMAVNPSLAASVSIDASPSGAICPGTSVIFTATPSNGGTTPFYQWKLNGGSVGTDSATYTNSALANGDYVTCVMTSNATPCLTGSPATANVVTMIVESGIPVAPVLTDIVLACNQTVVTGTWAAVANTANYKFDVSLDPLFGTFISGYQDISVAPTPTPSVVVNGLTPGVTYYVRARTVNGCGAVSANSNVGTASVTITKTSDGSSWDNGMPDSSKKIIFTGNATLSSSLNACSCQINSGIAVQVDSGTVMTLENGLAVAGTGTLTFENNASLVQVNDAAVNTGTIIYKRNTTPMKNYDYTYWSSPVAGQTLQALSPNTLRDKYFSYSLNNWVTQLDGLSTMIAGKGYIIRVPKPDITYPNGEYWTGATYIQSVQFVGVPNNGVYSLPIDPVGYNNLIGNPYPCAMSADAFLLENSINNSRLGGTIYFWTHNTAIANGRYSGTDFASYNYLGGVGTFAAPSGSTGGANNNIPSGNIAAGQSFFAESTGGAGPVVFNNSMRVSLVNKNSQFFKGTQSKAVPIEKHRVWLNLTNTEGAFKQMLVGYVTGATNGFDSAFDGVSLDSNKYIDFYSVNDKKNFVIQGRALPFDKTDKVPLGYKTTIEGTFEISIDQVDGILAYESVFVEDKVKGVVVDLKKGPYSFSTSIGTFNDRFVLRFTDNVILASVLNTAILDRPVIVSVQNHQIKINSFNEIMDKLMIYDLNGRLLYKKENVNSNEFSIPDFNSSEQFLIVQTLLKNDEWFTIEIVF
ncbi:fibronectin type III domain-containing protein [Flavobacterium sp. ZT3R18]|uniref:Ig-like domain-containing protein n=1 Tax=Flavobacterium sp. ZT3R18 TaxID=2594429 RepID=UPI00117BDBF4|nr:T9SS sorting signal type C domain-containing protein [Flavobacterium sp. ZT3R18]TRX33531.1 fibronectin type III domain-containing protein [Flavobacterium sp. ZT3R18]